jgi:hypothetical protein
MLIVSLSPALESPYELVIHRKYIIIQFISDSLAGGAGLAPW